jgi:ribokinase
MSSPAIFVVGSSNMDLLAYVPRFPKKGETLHGSKFATGFGGKGANQAVMAAKMGANVGMMTCVGDDLFGKDTLANYKRCGVDTRYVHVSKSGTATGVAPITVTDQGENSIVIVNGANDELSVEHVQEAKAALQSAKVVICQLEIRVEVSLEALKIAKAGGATLTIFNPAPARPDLPAAIFGVSDIICPNETEAEILTGISVSTEGGAVKAANRLVEMGCRSVVMTLGERGCLIVEGGKSPVFVAVPVKVKPVDSSGAGDCFLGTLAFCLAEGDTLQEACRRANHVAALSVTKPGTQTSYPSAKDLPANIAKKSKL